MFVFPDAASSPKAAVREKTKIHEELRRKIKRLIRFFSLCTTFHWLDVFLVTEENGFVCVCVWLSDSVCMFAPSGGDDKILNIITGIKEFTKLSVMLSSTFNVWIYTSSSTHIIAFFSIIA